MKVIAAPRALPSDDPGCLIELELPEPQPGRRDLLVRIEAIAVNPIDTKVRAGLAEGSEPRILGWDAAGTVERCGEDVSRFHPGQRVLFAGALQRPGCNAEFSLVDERLCGHCPDSLSAAEAAALPLTGLTAWEGLFERLGLSPQPQPAQQGRSLLIIGAAGGVGSIAIQLARRAGLRVIATASRPQSQAWVKALGADAVLDHHQPLAPQLEALNLPWVDWIANVADTDAYWPQMVELLAPQGAILAIVGNRAPLDQTLLKSKSARLCWEFMFSRSQYATADMAVQGRIVERLAQLRADGDLGSTIGSRLGPISATNLARAHRQLEDGHTIGKLVLEGWS
ncbi:MAG: zinc-binding alcohol dehydrogenase family protein [Synechococcaceae cyanobacterium]|nr:zinc-binding alcohol dehydrogenase family protein [Synechococcaceae cyanobacterium]